jgi:uncharacterized protein (TIGR02145 family)/prepilin-type N-terminal cleavage/methylation domain-containing protein
MKKQGFTLVELLAVIIILAIILAIAVPSITGIIENVTINAFEQDAKMIIKSINYKLLLDDDFNVTDITKENINELLGVGNDNYETIEISKDDNGNPYIKIVGKNKWEGLTACGTYTNMEVGSDIECELPSSFVWGVDKLIDTRGSTPEEYATVKIGDQCWMAKNLKYIDNCIDKWGEDQGHENYTKGCKVIQLAELGPDKKWAEGEVHYQWGGAMNACPPGWHLPNNDEWTDLERSVCVLSGNSDCETKFPYDNTEVLLGTNEAYILKSNLYWDNDGNGNNDSGFNALPAGESYPWMLINVGRNAYWWSSYYSNDDEAWRRGLEEEHFAIARHPTLRELGMSVRCIRD